MTPSRLVPFRAPPCLPCAPAIPLAVGQFDAGIFQDLGSLLRRPRQCPRDLRLDEQRKAATGIMCLLMIVFGQHGRVHFPLRRGRRAVRSEVGPTGVLPLERLVLGLHLHAPLYSKPSPTRQRTSPPVTLSC